IVSDLEIAGDKAAAPSEALQFDDVAIVVEKAHGETCERCRGVNEDVGSHADAPTLCDRCATIVEEFYPAALEVEAE
ncbi:MAG: zinc finger domain-containing protein, partial [Carnobacterium maltaromaticum]